MTSLKDPAGSHLGGGWKLVPKQVWVVSTQVVWDGFGMKPEAQNFRNTEEKKTTEIVFLTQ